MIGRYLLFVRAQSLHPQLPRKVLLLEFLSSQRRSRCLMRCHVEKLRTRLLRKNKRPVSKFLSEERRTTDSGVLADITAKGSLHSRLT